MPSTERRLSLRLSYRRSETAGFWIVAMILWSLGIAVASASLGATAPWAWSAGSTAVVLLPRIFWDEWLQAGVWAWNTSVRLATPALRRYVLAVCYYTVFPIVGLSKSTMTLTSERAPSGWKPMSASAFGGPRPGVSGGPAPTHQGLLDAVRSRDTSWAIALWPLVFLLRLLGAEGEDTMPPTSTYTLY